MNRASIRRPASSYRAPLLQGCALALALAATGHMPQAKASGFQGTGTVFSGSASILQGATSDTITVGSTEVVIDWRPSDTGTSGTIDFLPTVNSVLYTDAAAAGLPGYTVLNRIQPVDASGNPVLRPIAFNGTVQTQLGSANFPVGNVWFYSPGGIIAGPTAVFNVGGLVLTTNAIDTTGGLFGSGGTIRFAGTSGSTSSVEIQAGAQINVVNPGSYVALVAPRVVQGGTVNVNGSVAYVGAEAATITINSGLFDISIGTGTDDANGVVHTGTTTGPATSTADPAPQRIFMAAVPKNNALTMLLTGDIGYTAAATAAEENSAIILSAGHDISGGQSVGTSNASTTASANISIGNSTFSSAVDGRASGAITINPTSFGTINFNANAAFKAATSITAGADNGETINALADLSLHAGTGGTGGIATLYADGIPFSTPPEGQVTVAGLLTVSSSATGIDTAVAGATGGSATGGTSEIRANGGTISAGTISLLSTATRGYGSGGSGNATGGTARIALTTVNGGGGISAGDLAIDVSAGDPASIPFTPANGGDAVGGTVQISADGGALSFATVNIGAAATGGSADVSGAAGDATGGTVQINFTGGDNNFDQLNVGASATGGSAGSGGTDGGATGSAQGITINVTGPAAFSIANGASLIADSQTVTGGATGPNSTGGKIAVTAANGGSFGVGGQFSASARALGFARDTAALPVAVGSVQGGTIGLSANGGTIGIGGFFLDASAQGSDASTTGGQATGGGISVTSAGSASGTGLFILGDCASFGCSIYADGTGGGSPDGANGTGGNVTLTAQDGILASDGPMFISASGFGGAEGNNGTTGDGFGGNVVVEILPGSTLSSAMTFGDLSIRADGSGLPIPGDYFGVGNGGLGQGGSVRVDVGVGVLGAQSLSMGTSGLGGPAGESAGPAVFTAGNGIGGQSVFNMLGGFADIGTFSIFATGEGGIAQSPGTGNLMGIAGNGTGGTARFNATAGTFNVVDMFVHAYGLGGASGDASDLDATSGGNGTGGTAQVIVNGSVTVLASTLEVAARGDGGAGGSGFSTGNAGAGGNGTGGTASASLGLGNVTIPAVSVIANGAGGTGGDQLAGGTPGSGGNGTGGSALLDGNDANYVFGAATLETKGLGGAGGSGGSGAPGILGDGTGGLTRVTNRDTFAPVIGRNMDSLTLDVSGAGTTILSGRMELSDVATFTGGGLVIANDLNALGTGPAASATSGFYFTGAGESISIGGNATIDTGGDAAFMLDGTGAFTVTGALLVNAGQNIFVGHTNNAATPVSSIDAASVDFTSGGNITGAAGSLIRGGTSLGLTSLNGFIDTNRLASGGPTQLDAVNGAVGVAVDLQSVGAVQATGQSVDIHSLGALNVTLASASAGNLNIAANNGLTLATGTASGALTLASSGGDVGVTNLTGSTIGINAFGTASFGGLSQAQTISVASSDLALGGAAQLGVAGTTTLLTLSNNGAGRQTFVGGANNTTGYSMSAAEMAQLFADSIALAGSAGQDVVVDSFTMASRAGVTTGSLGANGSLSINSSGNIRVIGAVALTGLGVNNQLFLTAANAVEVDAANASIDLSDANGGLMGQLNFDANEVFVATASAITDVRAASGTDAASARLALNDGVVRNSVISAATIFADVRGGLYIQNTGASAAFADRQGFAALTDTLDIATGSAATRIIVNGLLVDPATGTLVSGLDVIPLVRINGVVGSTSGNFDLRSTVNGCLITSPVLCTMAIDEIPGTPPPHETIETPLDPSGEGGDPSSQFPTTIVELQDFTPFGYPPLIDEPVTGAGNDDLWMPPCTEGTEEGCTPQ